MIDQKVESFNSFKVYIPLSGLRLFGVGRSDFLRGTEDCNSVSVEESLQFRELSLDSGRQMLVIFVELQVDEGDRCDDGHSSTCSTLFEDS